MSIYDAAMRYTEEGVPLIAIAGREYGTGSSRDWAAKGPRLLGIRAVIAEGYERIHRSNLIGMGVLPLEFAHGASAESIGLEGTEVFDIRGICEAGHGSTLLVRAERSDGSSLEFPSRVRLDTEMEVQYYRNGGILQSVLRGLLTD